MGKSFSIADARNRLAKVVHDVETGPPVELTRRGKRVAMIVSVREFERRFSTEEACRTYLVGLRWQALSAPIKQEEPGLALGCLIQHQQVPESGVKTMAGMCLGPC